MTSPATFRLTLVAVMALVAIGLLGGVARGQVASPVAEPPAIESETASLSAADLAYLAAITPIITTVQDSLVRYTALAEDPRFENQDWLEQFAFVLMGWRSAYQEARALEPPPLFAVTHSRYLDALGLLAATSDEVNAAVTHGDLAGLMRAGTRMMQATRLLDQSTLLLNRVTGEQGGTRLANVLAAATPAAVVATPAGGVASATPPTGEVSGQVNVFVEVNTYVGLGDLSSGGNTLNFTRTGACQEAGDEP